MKNNWKEEFDKEFQTTKYLQLDMNVYHVKTHRIQSHRQDIKDFITSLLEEQKKELLDLVEKEVGKLYEPYEGEEQIMIEHHMLDKVSTIINQLRV